MAVSISGTNGIQASALPFLVGQVCYFALPNAPTGFLPLDGRAISRTTYAALFAAIGTTYGSGDGSTTFNLPDARGEFLRGVDNGRGVDPGRTLGSWQQHQSNDLAEVSTDLRGDAVYSITVPSDGSWSAWVQSGEEGAYDNFSQRFRLHGRETKPRNLAFLTCIYTGVV